MNSEDIYYRLQFYQDCTRKIAQKYLIVQHRIKYIIILLSIFCAVLADNFAWIIILINCVLELLVRFLENKEKEYHVKNREACEYVLYQNSLDQDFIEKIASVDYTEFLADDSIMKNYDESAVNKSYYNTEEIKGYRKFAYNIAESVLYTKYLLEKQENVVKVELVVVTMISFLTTVFAFILITGNNRFLIVSPITTILAMLIFEDYESYFLLAHVTKKIGLIYERLCAIINKGECNPFILTKIYSEYSLLTREIDPVSSKLYQKYRDNIKKIWDNQYRLFINTFNEKCSNLDNKDVIVANNIDSIHREKARLIATIIGELLIDNGSDYDTVYVQRVSSYSRTILFDMKFCGKSFNVGIIVKMYSSEKEFLQAFKVTQILCDLNEKHYCNYLKSEELENNMTIAYYNVNQYSGDEYSSLSSAILNPNWKENREKYYSLVYAAVKFHESRISAQDSSLRYSYDANRFEVCQLSKKPADYIIDLSWVDSIDSSGTFQYSIEKTPQFFEGSSAEEIKFIGRKRITLLNWNDSSKVVGMMEVKSNKYLILLPLKFGYAPNDYIDIDFSAIGSQRVLYSTEQYLRRPCINIDLTDKLSESYIKAIGILTNLVRKPQICHNDLHAKNIFISTENFKIFDLEDTGYGYPYSDICRLQISILYYLSKKDENINIVKEFIEFLQKGDSNNPEIISIDNIRVSWEQATNYDSDNNCYRTVLLYELILQLYYCICSDRILSQEWIGLYQYLEDELF